MHHVGERLVIFLCDAFPGSFYTMFFITILLTSIAVLVLSWPAQYLVVSTPLSSFFFRTLQLIIPTLPNSWVSSAFKWLTLLSHRKRSVLYAALFHIIITAVVSGETQGSNRRVDIQNHRVFEQSNSAHRSTCQSHVPIFLTAWEWHIENTQRCKYQKVKTLSFGVKFTSSY